MLVDRPSYFVFLEMLRAMGVRAISIPVDDDGLICEETFARTLAELVETGDRDRIKAVYFVSYFPPLRVALCANQKRWRLLGRCGRPIWWCR